MLICICFPILGFFVATQSTDRIQTPFGLLQGLKHVSNGITVHEFMGIPYALPPIGHLRFAKPIPWTQGWTGIRSAKTLRKPCIYDASSSASEDCLYLNIWTPVSFDQVSPRKPVLIFIPTFGPFELKHDFVADMDAVVVVISYRVGALGFLFPGHPNGLENLGLHDQLVAIKWVKSHIHIFGGDPERVTLAGQGIGSMSVSLHTLSPLTSPLFSKAIMMSGAVLGFPSAISKQQALMHANDLSKALGCGFNGGGGPLSDQSLACLKKSNARKLFQKKVGTVFKNPFYHSLNFLPIYGDNLIPGTPLELLDDGLHKMNASFMMGTVTWEGFAVANLGPQLKLKGKPKEAYLNQSRDILSKFGGSHERFEDMALGLYFNQVQDNELDAKAAYLKLLGDLYIDCPMDIFTEYISKSNRVYRYMTTYSSSATKSSKFVPTQGDDLRLLFGTTAKSTNDKIVQQELRKAFAHFIHTGYTSWMPEQWRGQSERPFHEFSGEKGGQSSWNRNTRNAFCSFWRRHLWRKSFN